MPDEQQGTYYPADPEPTNEAENKEGGGGMSPLAILSAVLSLGKGIGSLFSGLGKGGEKVQATQEQQAIEKSAESIQQQVNAGSMDPATGISLIKNLISLASAKGQSIALTNLNQIYGNMLSSYHSQIAGGNAPPKDSPQGLGGVSQDPATQKAFVRNQVLQRLAGYNTAGGALEGSPLGQLTEKPQAPSEKFGASLETAKGMLPGYQPSQKYDELRKRLEGFRG